MRALEAVLVLMVGLFVLGCRLRYHYRFPAGVIPGTSKKIIADHVFNVLPILGVVLALLGMATAHPVRADWRRVPTDKQQINMQVPGMEHWNPGYWKTVDDDFARTAYHTNWRLVDDPGIHAYLTYQKSTRAFTYYTLKQLIRRGFREKDDVLSFDGKKKTYKSTSGKFKYIYFSLTTKYVKRKCVGFVNSSSGNRKLLYGHYCLFGDEQIGDAIVGPLIDSIDLGPGLN